MSPISSLLAQYIADREGLVGGARAWFLEILRREFRYEGEEEGGWDRYTLTAMLVSAATLGAVCIAREGLSWSDGTAWLGCAWVGTALHWLLRQRPPPPPDRDTEWRVYCALVRPLILLRYPSLLDRNRKDAEHRLVVGVSSMRQSFQVTASHARRELVVAALAGLWIGAALVPVLHYFAHVAMVGLTVLPVASAALAPVVWTMWRWYALRLVLGDIDD